MPKTKPEPVEQGTLIDIEPENAKGIARVARAYKRAQGERQQALDEEIKHKQKLLEIVKESEIVAGPTGEYKFRANGCIITVKPRDELVRVTFEEDSEDGGE